MWVGGRVKRLRGRVWEEKGLESGLKGSERGRARRRDWEGGYFGRKYDIIYNLPSNKGI